jgi:cation:H+ antiporter
VQALLDLSDDLAGVTLMAVGSALPEITISTISVMTGDSRVSVGIVTGSAMISYGFLPGE